MKEEFTLTELQTQAVEELTGFGFDAGLARQLVRHELLPLPLTDAMRRNIELLRRYIDLSDVNHARLIAFLTRAPEQNEFMAGVPGMMNFSPEERKRYEADPLYWDEIHDLRVELGPTLAKLVHDEDAVQAILRGMYLNAYTLCGCGTKRRICAALAGIDRNPARMEQLVREEWYVLFSVYSDTPGAIEELTERFGEDGAFEILCDHPELSRRLNRNEPGAAAERAAAFEELSRDYARFLRA